MFRFSLAALFLCSLQPLKASVGNFLRQSPEKSFINFAAFHGFRFLGNLSEQLGILDRGKCAYRCLELSSCFSFNFGSGSTCETSSSDFYRNKTALVETEGFSHFYIWNGCSSFPCLNNGTCQPIYSTDSYACQCTSDFGGLFCELKCGPLGMEDGRITDAQISVSSYFFYGGEKYDGSRARLNLLEWPAGWDARDEEPWIKVDLLETKKVVAIATQGWGRNNGDSYVTKYRIAWSVDDVVSVNY